jgi:hypothetical protein
MLGSVVRESDELRIPEVVDYQYFVRYHRPKHNLVRSVWPGP